MDTPQSHLVQHIVPVSTITRAPQSGQRNVAWRRMVWNVSLRRDWITDLFSSVHFGNFILYLLSDAEESLLTFGCTFYLHEIPVLNGARYNLKGIAVLVVVIARDDTRGGHVALPILGDTGKL